MRTARSRGRTRRISIRGAEQLRCAEETKRKIRDFHAAPVVSYSRVRSTAVFGLSELFTAGKILDVDGPHAAVLRVVQ
jgi:hypothetical protein